MKTTTLTPLLGTSSDLNFAASLVRSATIAVNSTSPAHKKIDWFEMLERAADIIEYRREITDEVESAINSAGEGGQP